MDAEGIALVAAGSFFLAGLLGGVWKYACIALRPSATAPVYVDVAHRAALLYAFACLLIERMLQVSALAPRVELVATVAQISFFALAVGTYVVHGVLDDTENQLARPHKLGARELPPALIVAFMVSLIVAEAGGFAVLFYGVLSSVAWA